MDKMLHFIRETIDALILGTLAGGLGFLYIKVAQAVDLDPSDDGRVAYALTLGVWALGFFGLGRLLHRWIWAALIALGYGLSVVFDGIVTITNFALWQLGLLFSGMGHRLISGRRLDGGA